MFLIFSELNHQLFWLSGINDKVLENLYQQANCLIAASLDEGFGLPPLEAARFQTQVLARDLPVFREVLGDYPTYFSSFSALELADVIEHWIESKHLGKGVDLATLKRTWAENIEDLKAVLIDPDLSKTLPMKAASLNELLSAEGEDFIRSCYGTFLNRIPSRQEHKDL